MGQGFCGDRVGREMEKGVPGQRWPSQSPLAEVFQLQTPEGPGAGPGEVNNLLTVSLSLVCKPKPPSQGVHEKDVHKESKRQG